MGTGRSNFLLLGVLACFVTAGCSASEVGGLDAKANGDLTIVGVRMTQGDAVVCPEVWTDDGKAIFVSGLTADVAIGDRIEVSGTMKPTTTCIGLVLVVRDLSVIERGANRTEIAVPRVPGN